MVVAIRTPVVYTLVLAIAHVPAMKDTRAAGLIVLVSVAFEARAISRLLRAHSLINRVMLCFRNRHLPFSRAWKMLSKCNMLKNRPWHCKVHL